MRLEDIESKRANDMWKESDRELTRMIGFESISESIESIVDDTFNLIGDANFDEAENQLQAELGNKIPCIKYPIPCYSILQTRQFLSYPPNYTAVNTKITTLPFLFPSSFLLISH